MSPVREVDTRATGRALHHSVERDGHVPNGRVLSRNYQETRFEEIGALETVSSIAFPRTGLRARLGRLSSTNTASTVKS
jgi:hypothetical protein